MTKEENYEISQQLITESVGNRGIVKRWRLTKKKRKRKKHCPRFRCKEYS
jgi:hypothetical protein